MTKRAMFLALTVLVSLKAESLTDRERDFAVEDLQRTRKLFLEALAGLSDKQWNFKPAPER